MITYHTTRTTIAYFEKRFYLFIYLKQIGDYKLQNYSASRRRGEFADEHSAPIASVTMEARHATLGRRTVQYKQPLSITIHCLLVSFYLFSSGFDQFLRFLFVHHYLYFLLLNFYGWSHAQLEEIRQKRAAERLSKTSSGPDLGQVPSTSGQNSPPREWTYCVFIIIMMIPFLCALFSAIQNYFSFPSETSGMSKSESANRLSEVTFFFCIIY